MFKLDIKYLLIAKRSSVIKHIPGYMPSIFLQVARCLCSKSMPTNWIDYGTEFQFSGPKDANNQTSGCAGEDGSGYRATLSCGRWKRPPEFAQVLATYDVQAAQTVYAIFSFIDGTCRNGQKWADVIHPEPRTCEILSARHHRTTISSDPSDRRNPLAAIPWETHYQWTQHAEVIALEFRVHLISDLRQPRAILKSSS